MQKKIRMFITVLVGVLLLGFTSSVFAENSIFTDSAVSRAAQIQAQNENALLSQTGVQGVGIGEKDGKLGILILVDEQSREFEMPTEVEDMPVIVREVGQIKANQVNLGVSGGNDITCPASTPGYIICDVGTIGFKVCDNTTPNVGGWISNNHVVVSGCTGTPGEKCPNMAPIGTNMFSPGLPDNTPVCSTTGATNVGNLNRFVTFNLDSPTTQNLVDAAFVESSDEQVSANINGLGAQSNTVVAPSIGQVVCKSGRTTSVTCGTVTGINLTIDVGYDTCGTARFVNQVMYSPTAPDTTMSESGDSGSPVVDSSNNAVALNFAGDDDGNGFGNPMGTVLTQLNVSLCSDIPEPPEADAGGPYTAECEGTTTTVQLDGTGSTDPDGDALIFSWTTNCPSGSFDNSASSTPELTVDTSSGCNVTCTVTLTVTDATGNTDSDTASVTIGDTSPPAIICPADITIECDESADPGNTGSATAADVCDPSVVATYSDITTPGSCPQESTIARTWTATDDCGNSSSCVQIINVVDTTAPVVSCNAPATITPPDVPISFIATATDNCDEAPTVEIMQYDCTFETKKGKEIGKKASCIVTISGDTISISDSGGVGDHIKWMVRATDCTGNESTDECEVVVVNPAK